MEFGGNSEPLMVSFWYLCSNLMVIFIFIFLLCLIVCNIETAGSFHTLFVITIKKP